ncbi:MAG TPA: DNA repair protein RecN [Thermodesulfobacteriaceae bacterium]|nr:DNA repair protein RecN [Thermodesulfobacteriaceae bacterium]
MLLELGIENFVLVKKAFVTLAGGLTVLTGETGAGKSLVVQALKLVLGARADSRQIRSGEEQATVQAVFAVGPDVRERLDSMGIQCDDELVIRRIIPVSARGRIYVNGAIVTLQDLKQITSRLVSMAGQHSYQELLRQSSHRHWLDRYAGLEKETAEFGSLFARVRGLGAALEDLITRKQSAEEERERLEREASAIDSVAPEPGEDERLGRELKVLKASEALRELGEACYRRLYSKRGSVQEQLSECRSELERMADLDGDLGDILRELESAAYQLEESAFSIRDYLHRLPSDLSLLEKTEERLFQIRSLKRRFGPGIRDVLAYRDEIEGKIAGLDNLTGRMGELKRELEEEENLLLDLAGRLSERRRRAAAELADAVKEQLAPLKLEKADFAVEVERPDNPEVSHIGEYGFDQVKFLFRPNVGEPLRPLASIASGGELSRVMLALRACFAGRSGTETIVFDEIDAGIGGEAAAMVGEKLGSLSSHGQVIAVTHFPQIAARADCHLLVRKKVRRGRTVTGIRQLEGTEKMEELARMLGGDRDAAMVYARELFSGRSLPKEIRRHKETHARGYRNKTGNH